MSNKQWGHGFYAGIKKAEKITGIKIKIDNKEYSFNDVKCKNRIRVKNRRSLYEKALDGLSYLAILDNTLRNNMRNIIPCYIPKISCKRYKILKKEGCWDHAFKSYKSYRRALIDLSLIINKQHLQNEFNFYYNEIKNGRHDEEDLDFLLRKCHAAKVKQYSMKTYTYCKNIINGIQIYKNA